MPYQQPPAIIQEHKGEAPKKRAGKEADVIQESSGPNSPNIVVGDHGTVIVEQGGREVKYQWPGFEEKVDSISFSFGEGGLKVTQPLELLRKSPYSPIKLGEYSPVTIWVVGDTFHFSFRANSGVDTPAIEVQDNQFKVKSPGWEWNSSRNAFEVVNQDGKPVFQFIRKSESWFIINGFLVTPFGKLYLLPGQYLELRGSAPVPPGTPISLKPIFRYPSWKYPGEFAE